MKTNNTSIKAIIFTILLFGFIFFISLFKGIHLYNIRFKNFYIKNLFIKIDDKIVLKINNIKANSSSSSIDFRKIVKYIKLLNYFQKLEILDKDFSLYLNNTHLKIESKDILINGITENGLIYFKYIYLKNLKFKNLITNLNYKNYTFEGSVYFQNQEIMFKGKIYKKSIIFDITIPSLLYKNNIIKNTKLKVILNSNFKYKIIGNINKTSINYNKLLLNFENINIEYNKNLCLFIENIHIPEYEKLNNIKADNINILYDIKRNFVYSKIKEIKLNYLDYKLSSDDNSLILKNKDNFNFTSNTITILLEDKKIVLKSPIFIKLNKFITYTIDNAKIDSKDINLTSPKKIVGDLIKIYIPIIAGKIFDFNTSIKDINISIKNKSLKVKEIVFNNIKANNILFKNNALYLTSNALFNKYIKEIIKKFLKIDIPLTQLGGKNEIFLKTVFDKNISIFTNVKTKISLFKLFNSDLFVKKGEVNITNKDLIFNSIATLYLNKNLPINYKGDGKIDFKKNDLIMDGIFNLNIQDIINLKNFKDKLYVDFNKSILKTENSNIFINFNKQQLIIKSLKNIISFTNFKDFIKDGIVLIYLKKKIDIVSYFLLKKPLFYEHSNLPISNKTPLIKKMFFLIRNENNTTNFYNNYTNITINNNSINAIINSIDINLYPLEDLFFNNNFNNNKKDLTITLNTKNSNLIYKTHKFLSKNASFYYANKNLKFNSNYKNSSLIGYTKNNYLLIEGKNFSLEEFKAFLPAFNFFDDIKLSFVMVKSPDEFFNGKIYIDYGVIKDLKLLNNIIAFINTIPSLVTFSSPGFSSKGYKIKNGYIDYLFYKNIFYIKKAKIKGNNLNFDAKGYIDFNKSYIFLKVKANMKIKVEKIPIIGKSVSYLLLGTDGSIDIKMIVKGSLNNPKVKKDLGKEILQTPFNIFKRAITLPFHLY